MGRYRVMVETDSSREADGIADSILGLWPDLQVLVIPLDPLEADEKEVD